MSLSEIYTHIPGYTEMSEKGGGGGGGGEASTYQSRKTGQSYTFCWKKVANHIPGCAEKGGHSARTAALCHIKEKGKRKVQGVPQSQTAALPRPQEEEETDKSKQAQTEQTYEKH